MPFGIFTRFGSVPLSVSFAFFLLRMFHSGLGKRYSHPWRSLLCKKGHMLCSQSTLLVDFAFKALSLTHASPEPAAPM